jgi:hypothetical protein
MRTLRAADCRIYYTITGGGLAPLLCPVAMIGSGDARPSVGDALASLRRHPCAVAGRVEMQAPRCSH